ncbi:MAG: Eco29kI family restriction endonuclease, partial [Kiritimatiellae bacterium]|nr:Eco29kI family restriction endonuclease [Kiritimatiellia bacterium]
YGVPQRRHRVFFIGFRSDVNVGWSFPKPTHSQEALLRAKFVDGVDWQGHGLEPSEVPERMAKRVARLRMDDFLDTTLPWLTVRDAFRGLPDPRPAGNAEVSNHRHQPGARSYPGHDGSPLDEPAKALKAGDHGVPGGENMLRYPNGKVRYFTVRESARIQTFPDDFIFPGSWTESMRQLGNAVPVELSWVVASSLQLYNRLKEHSRAIKTTNLNLADFTCRHVAIQSGMQAAVEHFMIGFYRPIWNKEIKVCFGIGKHGDSTKTRANKRSPWDTMHPGRKWAENTKEDQKTRMKVEEDIHRHLEAHPPIPDLDALRERLSLG